MFLRLFWEDARRVDYFAVLGFVIEPATMRERLFAGAHGRAVDAVLARRGGDLPLHLRVTDERGGRLRHPAPRRAGGARVTFPMLFYPADDIRSRVAAGVPPRPWTIEVGAPALAGALAGAGQRYWPTAFSLLLMLVALGLTVQAHRRSTELARMQTDFVAHVSHQLKTPLSLLSAATETLQMDRIRSPEKLAEYLDTIRAEAQRLSALVQRVLEFSRVQQQRSYEFEQVDLGALVRETVDAFAHGLRPARPVRGRAEPAPGRSCGPTRRRSSRWWPTCSTTPSSTRRRPAGDGDRARRTAVAIIEVTDRGVGIAAAEQARIFERFYRVPGAAHRQGFGLGLPIVRELVHAQGGRVDVSSAPGRRQHLPGHAALHHRAGDARRPAAPPAGGRVVSRRRSRATTPGTCS